MAVWEAAPMPPPKIAACQLKVITEEVHPPPEVVDEVFSSMIDSIPRTKEEVIN